jgi:hypothetical protein
VFGLANSIKINYFLALSRVQDVLEKPRQSGIWVSEKNQRIVRNLFADLAAMGLVMEQA